MTLTCLIGKTIAHVGIGVEWHGYAAFRATDGTTVVVHGLTRYERDELDVVDVADVPTRGLYDLGLITETDRDARLATEADLSARRLERHEREVLARLQAKYQVTA